LKNGGVKGGLKKPLTIAKIIMEQVATAPRTYQQKRDWDFRNLNIWKEGHALTMRLYETTKRFPQEEAANLATDLRRTATHLTSTIACALNKSSYKEKIQGYEAAASIIPELQNLIMLARDLGYCTPADGDDFHYRADTVSKMTYGLIKASKTKMQNQEK
jgi:four helix bundle protein